MVRIFVLPAQQSALVQFLSHYLFKIEIFGHSYRPVEQ